MIRQHLGPEALREWVDNLVADHQVIAPVRRLGRVTFAAVFTGGEVAWDAGRTDVSAKGQFFPANEALFQLRAGETEPETHLPDCSQPRVLIGARPCDGQALAVLDRLLLAHPADPYYAQRRAGTAVVALACPPGGFDGCFCHLMGGGPDDRSHVDVLLTEVDDGYVVEPVTERGATLVARGTTTGLDRVAPTPALPKTDLTLAPAEDWRAAFNDPLWAELAERCLGCRVCTYDCPVCYCFDVRDRVRPDGSTERLRCWDSCQGASCFAIAGGHNPRPTQAARQRQRYMHKFLYYPVREGVPLCVGCGRCVTDCPANIDIREVMAHVAAVASAATAEVTA